MHNSDMTTTKTELRRNPNPVFDHILAGGTVTVTHYGMPMAVMTRPDGALPPHIHVERLHWRDDLGTMRHDVVAWSDPLPGCSNCYHRYPEDMDTPYKGVVPGSLNLRAASVTCPRCGAEEAIRWERLGSNPTHHAVKLAVDTLVTHRACRRDVATPYLRTYVHDAAEVIEAGIRAGEGDLQACKRLTDWSPALNVEISQYSVRVALQHPLSEDRDDYVIYKHNLKDARANARA